MTATAITAHHATAAAPAVTVTVTAAAMPAAVAAVAAAAAPPAPPAPARFVEARDQLAAVRDLLVRAGSEQRDVRDEELAARRPELLALRERLWRLRGRGVRPATVSFAPAIEALLGRLHGLEPDLDAAH